MSLASNSQLQTTGSFYMVDYAHLLGSLLAKTIHHHNLNSSSQAFKARKLQQVHSICLHVYISNPWEGQPKHQNCREKRSHPTCANSAFFFNPGARQISLARGQDKEVIVLPNATFIGIVSYFIYEYT